MYPISLPNFKNIGTAQILSFVDYKWNNSRRKKEKGKSVLYINE